MSGTIQDIASRLDNAARQAVAIPQISNERELGMDDAYAVQAELMRLRKARGERLVGMKMGFTSRAKMAQMGLSEMIFSQLTDAMLVEDGGAKPHAAFIHPRVEPEVAFCLRKRLAGRVTLTEAAAAVEWIAPAVEIIDSRYRDFKFSLADVVADNSSSSGFAIGAASLPTIDIANLGMVLSIDGLPREIGSSAAILGNPWRSLVAAAAFAARYGFELRPGDVVMAGGATAAVAVGAGARIALETQNLARVQFTLSGAA